MCTEPIFEGVQRLRTTFLTSDNANVDRDKLHEIDLHSHDLRHEGACRLLADDVDIRIIQLMLGHSSVQQAQRYLP
jgi:integrase